MIVFCWYFWPFTNCSQKKMEKSPPANPLRLQRAEVHAGPISGCVRMDSGPSVCASERSSSFLSPALSHPACSLAISPCLEVMCSAHLVIANGIFGHINVINFTFCRAGLLSKPQDFGVSYSQNCC